MKKLNVDIEEYNKVLRHKSPNEIIEWAISLSEKRIVTTSFGVYSGILLSTFHQQDPGIDVIWCDTGYNNVATYQHAYNLIHGLNLNISIYTPKLTKAYADIALGLPTIDDPKHKEFSELVKLEPFRRAIEEHKPELWFTNIRVRQTAYRDSLDILSYSKEGILKISPFYYWSDEDLDDYLKAHNIPKNTSYFDPVKALQSRECGIHVSI